MNREATFLAEAASFVHAIEAIDAHDLARFGGKATGLARMARAGIPVPPAFVIGTDGYRAFRAEGRLPVAIAEQARAAMGALEAATGRRFASAEGFPLLVSVRSGAQVSMPGMMDTVLNLGIDAASAFRLAQASGSAAFALDTWMRFWRMFADIVLGADGEALAETLAPALDAARAEPTRETFATLEPAVLAALAEQGSGEVQADPHWQLQRAIAAVFESWDSRRAKAYRAHHAIPDDLGTAVTIQAMVFGNRDQRSGSGVAFTRNPNTGARELYGEFLLGRQGEDLVAGTATPSSIAEPGALGARHRAELIAHGQTLERLYGDAVDIEFTVEAEHLYFLQVRPAKRTAQAALRIAAELVEDGVVGAREAVGKVSVEQLKRLLRPAFDPEALAAARPLAQGIGASPGHSYGVAVLDADRAATLAASGERVILLRPTTSPQDIRGMLASQAIVTARGGALSHAAVVSRALDVPCVVGCEALEIEPERRRFRVGGQDYEEGTPLSVDGGTGLVYGGVLPLESATHAAEHIGVVLGWSDELSGAAFWASGVTGADVRAVLRHRPRGLGVVALTDLLIASNTLGTLLDLINELSQQPDGKDAQDCLARLAYDACRQLFLESGGIPVHLRLPNLGSPRAQRMISTWASLAPRLFLPLGSKGLYVPLLRGIADAARDAGHGQVTPLVAGVSVADEVAAFARAAAALGLPRAGAVLQSPAGLAEAGALAATGGALWVDIRELIRTYYGYPSALSFGDEVFESYVADGYLRLNPRKRLGPHLHDMLGRLAEAVADVPAASLGVDCGEGAALTLVEDLYAAGLRTFSAPLTALAGMRLTLGQRVAREHDHG